MPGATGEADISESEWLDTSFSICGGDVDYKGLIAAACDEEGQPEPHRHKQVENPFQHLGLVTRTSPATSPEFHSQRGREAIMAVVNHFCAEVVWDESTVADWSEVWHNKKDSFTPMSGLVFLIMG